MKYSDFKIFKFSTISKRIDHIRYSFSRIPKIIKTILRYVADFLSFIEKYIFSEIHKSIKFIIHYFSKIYNFMDLRRLDFKKVYKYFDIRRYDYYRINKKINFANYKHLPIYFVTFVIFIGFVYVVIPIFYSYDKLKIVKTICKDQNIECLIKGEVNYSFFPTPRIKIKDLIINDFFEKKKTLATVENTEIKLSVKDLLTKEKHQFEKIELNNFEINFDLKNLKKYKNIFTKNINFIPATFTKGKIIFFNENNYVATINDTKLNLILEEDFKFM